MTALITFDRLPPAALDSPAPERCIGTPPQRSTWSVYQGDGGEVDCGLWSCQPGAWRIAFHAHRHEFFHVLEGRIRITDAAGDAKEFGPGDACHPRRFQGRVRRTGGRAQVLRNDRPGIIGPSPTRNKP